MRFLIFILLLTTKVFAQNIDTLKIYCPNPKWVDNINKSPIYFKNHKIKCSKCISYQMNQNGEYINPGHPYNITYYNNFGYIIKEVYDGQQGGGISNNTFIYYKYDSLNRIIEEKETDSLGNSKRVSTFSYDSTKSGYHKDPHYNMHKKYKIDIDTIFNKKHQIIETKSHNYPKDGHKELYIYNREGKLIKKEFYINFNTESVYRMNDNGIEIKNNGNVKEIKT